MEKWKKMYYVFALFPVLYIVFLFLFYVHSSIALGFFPTFDNPNPKAVRFYEVYEKINYEIVDIGVLFVFIWAPLSVIYLMRYQKRAEWRPIIVCALAYLLGYLTLFTEVVGWFNYTE